MLPAQEHIPVVVFKSLCEKLCCCFLYLEAGFFPAQYRKADVMSGVYEENIAKLSRDNFRVGRREKEEEEAKPVQC